MMTKTEILSCFYDAQQQQAEAFMVKKVSYYINTDYTWCTSRAHFSVSVFYGKENQLFNFSVGPAEDIEEVRVNMGIARAIIEAASAIEEETE